MGAKDEIIFHPLDDGKKLWEHWCVFTYLFLGHFITVLFSFVVLNQSGTHQIKLPNATLRRKADFCVKIKRSSRFLQRIWKYMNVPGESGGERDR